MPLLNRQNLQQEFNVSEEEPVEPEILEDEFEKEWDDTNNPRTIIKDNIERANAILDKVEIEINSGNFSARLVEVAGNIINSITAASKELISDENYKQYLSLRKKLVKYKKLEVDFKISGRSNSKITNQNLILTNREDLLKLMNKNKNLFLTKKPEDKKD